MKNLEFFKSIELNKCLPQLEIPDLLQMCAHLVRVPSNISTMGKINTTAESISQGSLTKPQFLYIPSAY